MLDQVIFIRLSNLGETFLSNEMAQRIRRRLKGLVSKHRCFDQHRIDPVAQLPCSDHLSLNQFAVFRSLARVHADAELEPAVLLRYSEHVELRAFISGAFERLAPEPPLERTRSSLVQM